MHMARPPAWAPHLSTTAMPGLSCPLVPVGSGWAHGGWGTRCPATPSPLASGHRAHVVHSVKSLWPLFTAPTLSRPGFSHNLWCQWMGVKMYLLKPELLPTWFLSLPRSSRHTAVPLHPMRNLQALALLGLGMCDWGYGLSKPMPG